MFSVTNDVYMSDDLGWEINTGHKMRGMEEWRERGRGEVAMEAISKFETD